jgi:hypothetical protein
MSLRPSPPIAEVLCRRVSVARIKGTSFGSACVAVGLLRLDEIGVDLEVDQASNVPLMA